MAWAGAADLDFHAADFSRFYRRLLAEAFSANLFTMMDQRAYSVAELTQLGVAYMRGTGMSRTKLSILAAGHNRLMERLLEGFDCRTQAAEKASDWFDANWPANLPWPAGIERRRLAQAA